MKLILPVVFLACMAVASVFPADPSGVGIIDRAFVRASYSGVEHTLYITLFNSEGRGTVKIDKYRNGEWETVCTCNPRNLDDEFIVFNPITVLNTSDQFGSLQVSWEDRVEYHEGWFPSTLCITMRQGNGKTAG